MPLEADSKEASLESSWVKTQRESFRIDSGSMVVVVLMEELMLVKQEFGMRNIICTHIFSASMPTHSHPPLDGVWNPLGLGPTPPSNNGWECVGTKAEKICVQIT